MSEAPDHWLEALVPDAHLTAIGKVTVKWSFLEFNLGMAIISFSKIEDKHISQTLTAPMDIRMKLRVLSALISYSSNDESLLNRYSALRNTVESLLTRRNHVIHGLWLEIPGYQPSSALNSIAKIKKNQLKLGSELMSVEDLTRLSNEIGEVDYAMNSLFVDLLGERRSSPDKSRSEPL